MRKKYFLLTSLLFCISVFSQENAYSSFDVSLKNSIKFNKHLINPAFSFAKESAPTLTIVNRRQWVNFDNAPEFYFANYLGRLSNRSRFGVGVYQQTAGLLKNFGGVINYSYSVPMGEQSILTFGLNTYFYNSTFDFGKIITVEDEPLLQNQKANSLIGLKPGINFGTEFFDFGVSVNNLVLYNLATSEMVKDNQQNSYLGHVMYTGYINGNRGFFDDAKFVTLFFVEKTKDATGIAGNVMLEIPNKGWAQGGYNTLYGFSAGVGITISEKFSLGYNYDLGIGDVSQLGASHQFLLAYTFEEYQEITRTFYTTKQKPSKPSKKTTTLAIKTKAQIEKEKADKLASEKLERERLAAEAAANAEKNRLAKEESARLKAEEDKAKLEALSNTQAEKDRLAAEEAASKKAADDKAKAEAASKAQAEKDRLAAEAAALKKAADDKAKADKNRLEAEESARKRAAADKARAQAAAVEKAADDKAKAEAALKSQAEKDRLAAEAAALKKAADDKAKAEAALKSQAEKDRLAAEAAALKKAADDKAKAEAALKSQAEKDRLAAEAAALKKAADDKAKAEAALKVQAEKDRLAAEAAALKKAADDKAKAEAASKAQAEKDRLAAEAAALKKAADDKAKAEAALKVQAEKDRLAAEAAALKKAADDKAKADAASLSQTEKDRLAAEALRLKIESDQSNKIVEAYKKDIDLKIKASDDLTKGLESIVKERDADLKEFLLENTLNEDGTARAPKAFFSTSESNAKLESIKSKINLNKSELDKLIRDFEASNNKRLKEIKEKGISEVDAKPLNDYYLKVLNELKQKRETFNRLEKEADIKIQKIVAEKEAERLRRIKKADYDSETERNLRNQQYLEGLKKNQSGVVENQSTTNEGQSNDNPNAVIDIPIIKKLTDVSAGYYLVLETFSNLEDTKTYLSTVIKEGGGSTVNFFYNLHNSTYYVYIAKTGSMGDANQELKAKGTKAYNKKMFIAKVE